MSVEQRTVFAHYLCSKQELSWGAAYSEEYDKWKRQSANMGGITARSLGLNLESGIAMWEERVFRVEGDANVYDMARAQGKDPRQIRVEHGMPPVLARFGVTNPHFLAFHAF